MSEADRLFTDGEAYERLMGRWSKSVGGRFLDWLDVPRGLRWLDIGCGNGAFTEEVVARCSPSSVMAIDPSDDQLAYARTRPGTTMAEFRVGDAQTLPLDDHSFDVAVMALVISFVSEPAKAVMEMARVVRRSGWVATYMWDFLDGGAPVDHIYAALRSLGFASPMPPNPEVSRRDVLQKLWEKAGLEAVDTHVIRIPVVYSDFDDYWDANTVPIGPQGKIISGMSPSEREQLRTRLRKYLPTTPDGRIAYESFANVVKGRVAK